MTTESQRAELLALADKATPRPYYTSVTGQGVTCVNASQPEDYHGHSVCVEGEIKGNAAYIAAACNLAPELAREVEELRNEIADLVTYYVQRRNSLASEVMEMTDKVKEFANNIISCASSPPLKPPRPAPIRRKRRGTC